MAEIQNRIAEESQKLAELTGKKREAARAYAGGASPVTLNKVQADIQQQQGLIDGLEQTLAMVEDVATEKRHELATAEWALEDAHKTYWRAKEKQILADEFEQAKAIMIKAWRAALASGQVIDFDSYAQHTLAFSTDEVNQYPVDTGKIPEHFQQSNLIRYEDWKHVLG